MGLPIRAAIAAGNAAVNLILPCLIKFAVENIVPNVDEHLFVAAAR